MMDAFSSSRAKKMKFSSLVDLDPIPFSTLQLFSILKDVCHDQCIVSGTAALAKYTRDLPSLCDTDYALNSQCLHHRVEFFVPHWPATTPHHNRFHFQESFHSHYLPVALYQLQQRFGITHSRVQETDASKDALYQHLGVLSGFVSRLDFHLMSSAEPGVMSLISIITVLGSPSRGETWGDFVTGRFDVDLCKGLVQLNAHGTCSHIAFPPSTLLNIHDGELDFCIQPGQSFPNIVHRMIKYRLCGFAFRKISFSPLLSLEWREHIEDQMRVALAPIWLANWRQSTGLHIPDQIIRGCIIPFLRPISKRERLSRHLQLMEAELLAVESIDQGRYDKLHYEHCKSCMHVRMSYTETIDVTDGVWSPSSPLVLAFGI